MARKEFSDSVIQAVLIKSRRHCCICDKWCGQRIEVHHIDEREDATEDNALPVCLDCHAEVRAYDPMHPIGKKYSPPELKELKRITFSKYGGTDSQSAPIGTTEYGRGFKEGAEWAKTQQIRRDIWRLLSIHGDFALEILYHFRTDNYHTMMDELLLSDDAQTGLTIRQSEGHRAAWNAGELIALWGIDGDKEQLFLTDKGSDFWGIVRSTPDLSKRFAQLESYWDAYRPGQHAQKPTVSYVSEDTSEYVPGPMNALSLFVNCFATTSINPNELYVIRKVSPASSTLSSIADGSQIVFSADEIRDVRIDQKTGNFTIEINPHYRKSSS